MLNDLEIQDFYKQFYDDLCDHLTVIKGYVDLSNEKDQLEFSNLRREIEDMEITIKRGIDERNRWYK